MKKEDGFMQQLIIKIVNNVQIVINVSRSFGSSNYDKLSSKKKNNVTNNINIVESTYTV